MNDERKMQAAEDGGDLPQVAYTDVPAPSKSIVSRAAVDKAPAPLLDYTLVAFLSDVGTFDPMAFNEVQPNLTPANGALGFNIPSLVSVRFRGYQNREGSLPRTKLASGCRLFDRRG